MYKNKQFALESDVECGEEIRRTQYHMFELQIGQLTITIDVSFLDDFICNLLLFFRTEFILCHCCQYSFQIALSYEAILIEIYMNRIYRKLNIWSADEKRICFLCLCALLGFVVRIIPQGQHADFFVHFESTFVDICFISNDAWDSGYLEDISFEFLFFIIYCCWGDFLLN